jgi:hypothetical protein
MPNGLTLIEESAFAPDCQPDAAAAAPACQPAFAAAAPAWYALVTGLVVAALAPATGTATAMTLAAAATAGRNLRVDIVVSFVVRTVEQASDPRCRRETVAWCACLESKPNVS